MYENQNRPPAFKGPGAQQKRERVGNFFKALAGNEASKAWCIDHRIALTKATGEGVDVVGGFVVPEEFDGAILAIRETAGAFRQGADIRTTRSMSQIRPRRTGGLTANLVAENAAIPESYFTLDAVAAALRKMAILGRGSTEILEDEAADIGEYLTSEIGYSFALKEDDCGFNGDGTSAYAGITGLGTALVGKAGAVSAQSGHNTYAALDATDLASLMGATLATAIPGAAWYMSNTAYALTICRLAGVSGGLVSTKRADGSVDASYLGFPIRFSAKLPNVQTSLSGSPMLYFGNLAMSSMIVEREQSTVIAMSLQRSLDTDQFLIRGVRRIDIINHLGGAGDPGPVAGLWGN